MLYHLYSHPYTLSILLILALGHSASTCQTLRSTMLNVEGADVCLKAFFHAAAKVAGDAFFSCKSYWHQYHGFFVLSVSQGDIWAFTQLLITGLKDSNINLKGIRERSSEWLTQFWFTIISLLLCRSLNQIFATKFSNYDHIFPRSSTFLSLEMSECMRKLKLKQKCQL